MVYIIDKEFALGMKGIREPEVSFSKGNNQLLQVLRKMDWLAHDGYYAAYIKENEVQKYHDFFASAGKQLRKESIAFADVEHGHSRISVFSYEAAITGDVCTGYEIRLSNDDMKALGIATHKARHL